MVQQWYHDLDSRGRRAFWTAYAGFGLDAMDVQIYAFVLPVLIGVWGLSKGDAGLLTSVTLIASSLGGWLGGALADRFGRKRILIATISCFAVATFLCGFARNFADLLVIRAIQGFGFGGEWAVGSVFISEIASNHARARMVGTVQSAWVTGWGLAAVIAAICLAAAPPELAWRIAFVAGSLPAVFLFAARRRLSEPPIFRATGKSRTGLGIFSTSLRRSTLLGCLLATGVHGGYWALATWWPTMLQSEYDISLTHDPLYFAVLLSGALAGYLVGGWLGDRTGRRATLATFALTGIVLALGFARFGADRETLLLFSLPIGFAALGMFSVIASILSELFPTEVRGSGLGFCYNFGRGAAGVGPVAIGNGAETFGLGAMLAIAIGCAYGIVLIAAFLLPETRGRALD